jgi:hypothetical protein
MHSIRIAEWILELSMTRERAEAVAGDLREVQRGTLWFWRSVVATMIASVWSDFRSAWWRLIAVALGVTAVVGAAQTITMDFILRHSTFEQSQWFAWPLNVLATLAVGRWIARWSGRREIASWLAATPLQLVINIIFFVFVSHPYAYWSLWLTARFYSLTLLGTVSARLLPHPLKRLPGTCGSRSA